MLKPIDPDYLAETIKLEPGRSRLHRLVARLCDTYYDDLSEERIEQLERQVDEWRWMHASGKRFA